MGKAQTKTATVKSATKNAARKVRSAKQKVTQVADEVSENVHEAAATAADNISDTVASAFGSQTEKASSFGQAQARKYILNAGRALEASGNQLRRDGMEDAAHYLQEAADKLLDAAVSIDNMDPRAARDRAESFIQERPLITFGGLALLGFAAASIISKRK